MSLIVDHLLVAAVEQRRTRVILGTADRRRRAGTSLDGSRTGSPFLTAGERQRLWAAFAALQPALDQAESVDILGYWTPSQAPRHTITSPTRRVLLDWGIWCCLVMLVVAHVIASV